MNKDINIEFVDREKTHVRVKIDLNGCKFDPQLHKRKDKIKYKTKDVTKMVKNWLPTGYNISKCIQDDTANNDPAYLSLVGKWVFEIKSTTKKKTSAKKPAQATSSAKKFTSTTNTTSKKN